jgi:hypothetical protein
MMIVSFFVMPGVIRPNVVTLTVVMLNAVAPSYYDKA